MNTSLFRMGLSFIVGLGCWFGQATAQTPTTSKPTTTTPAFAAPTPAVTVATEEPPITVIEEGSPARRFVPLPLIQRQTLQDAGQHTNDWLHRHGYGCGQHLDWYGCGGWRAQCTFVFGSCRTFFGEPCVPREAVGQGGQFGNGGGCLNGNCGR